MITFACEHCGKNLRVSDDLGGKKGRCPDCKNPTLIPDSVSPGTTKADAPNQRTRSEDVTAPPPSRGGATLPDNRPATKADASLTGKVIAGYEILGELGRGGMGVVYKARQQKPRRVVALKMILAGEHASSDALDRFQAEAEAIARLQHPSIVQIHEVGEHNGHPFFSLEFIEGGSLASLLREKKLKYREAADLMYEIARGVQYAHKKGVVHRDLKPANVLLTREENEGEKPRWIPKSTDFGLAKQMDTMASVAPGGPKTASGAIMGTPAYMSPEQAAGKVKQVGPASDVYSLGAILYEMLTGKPPFEAPSMLDTLFKVATEEPPPPRQVNPRIPRDLETICLKCMDKDSTRRYSSASAMAEDLRRYLDGEPIKARPQGGMGKLKRWAGRNKTLVYALAGSLFAVAIVVTSFLILLPSNKPIKQAVKDDDDEGGDGKNPGAIGLVRSAAARAASSNNLKQLGLAFHNVNDSYNQMPPGAIYDATTGKALLSWRVAILPYIEQDNLYKMFNLKEAWDSPTNIKLLESMPKTYEMPDTVTKKGHTHYQVFTGPNTLFPGTGQLGGPFGRMGPKIQTITDGSSNTILIVEGSKAVPWTKPEEIVIPAVGMIPMPGASKDSFLACLADGSVVNVSKTISQTTLRAAITPNGGEVLGTDWPDGNGTKFQEPQPKLPKDGPPKDGRSGGKSK